MPDLDSGTHPWKEIKKVQVQNYSKHIPIAAVILDVVMIITFGELFNLSNWVSRAFTTWDAIYELIVFQGSQLDISIHSDDEVPYKKSRKLIEQHMQDTLIESDGSEPDKAAFLAAARLSTSSARSCTQIISRIEIKAKTASFLSWFFLIIMFVEIYNSPIKTNTRLFSSSTISWILWNSLAT